MNKQQEAASQLYSERMKAGRETIRVVVLPALASTQDYKIVVELERDYMLQEVRVAHRGRSFAEALCDFEDSLRELEKDLGPVLDSYALVRLALEQQR